MTGFAVIDLETTGFAYNHTDRVCEIGVVLVGPDGRREDSWTTLVNPQRDLGAQHVHRIDALACFDTARALPLSLPTWWATSRTCWRGVWSWRTTAPSTHRSWWLSMPAPGGRWTSPTT